MDYQVSGFNLIEVTTKNDGHLDLHCKPIWESNRQDSSKHDIPSKT